MNAVLSELIDVRRLPVAGVITGEVIGAESINTQENDIGHFRICVAADGQGGSQIYVFQERRNAENTDEQNSNKRNGKGMTIACHSAGHPKPENNA